MSICCTWLGCGYTVLENSKTSLDDSEGSVVRRQVDQQAKRWSQRTYDEQKLHSGLYELLRLAEDADSVEGKRQEYVALLGAFCRESGRLEVQLILGGRSAIDPVSTILKGLGVEIVHTSPYSAYMICTVEPLDLRDLISIGSVQSIDIVTHGYHNN